VVLLINNDVAARLLSMADMLAAMESVIREEGLGTAANRTKANIHIPAAGDEWYRYCSMEGGSRGLGVVAIRIKSDMSSLPVLYGQQREVYYASRPGLYCGLILLFSAATGEPLAILNDGVIQHLRVGATYGLGAKYMARQDSRTLGMIGSGGMARVYAEAVALVRPLEQIKVYSPNRSHRDEYAAEMSRQLGIHVVPVDSTQEVAENVDLLAAMTDTMDPVIFPEMLQPGIHVCVVKNKTEATVEALEMVDWAVIYRSGAAEHCYTTPPSWPPPAAGGTTAEIVASEERALRRIHKLADVLLGRVPGRRQASDITFFNAEGTGTQFAAAAKLVYDRACEHGLGQDLPLDWFLQTVRN
jgi:alanine dehydrogenase